GCAFVSVESAEEMAAEVEKRAVESDVVVMAAAVADFRPEKVEHEKIKKRNRPSLQIKLVATPDIAASLGGRKRSDQTLVIFAAETERLLEHAAEKLREKRA